MRAYLEKTLLPATSRTLTDPAHIWEDIALIRKRGYAIADEELNEGIFAVAAAIGTWGKPVGSLSISAPKDRVGKERVEPYGTLVRSTAERISACLT